MSHAAATSADDLLQRQQVETKTPQKCLRQRPPPT
jgi:hypothetical protein